MKRKGIDITGISETHWTSQGKVQLAKGDSIICSRRDDDNPQGVGILMSKSAVRALIEWDPINVRIIQARYYSKIHKSLHSFIPTEDADEQEKDEFYTRLQDGVRK